MKTTTLPDVHMERVLALALFGAVLAISPMTAKSAEEMDMSGPHAQHHMMMNMKRTVVKSEVNYRIPEVSFIREDGAKVSLKSVIDDGKPVFLNFIFTTCTTVCPVLSRTFSMVQQQLGPEAGKVHLVSISIDPEQDTPARLAAYAKRFGAGPAWHFYTGTSEASIVVQKAFGTYRGDKMDHEPAIFIRMRPGQPWIRFDGFATAEEVVQEYQQLRMANNIHGTQTTCAGGNC